MTEEEPQDKMPDVVSAFTDMAAAAIGMHELFTSYVDAGFTRSEALQMVIALLQVAVQQGRDQQ